MSPHLKSVFSYLCRTWSLVWKNIHPDRWIKTIPGIFQRQTTPETITKEPSPPRPIIRYVTAGTLLLSLLTAGIIWHRFDRELNDHYIGYPEETKLVLIQPGSRTPAILEHLHQEGILRTMWPAWVYLWWNKERGGIRAGEYQFKKAMSIKTVMDILLEGKVYQRSLTVPEGWNRFQIAALLENKGFGSKTELQHLLDNPAPIKTVDAIAENLEGYLYPDTYFYTRGTTAKDMIFRMVSRFLKIFDPARRERAQALGLNIRDIVTLASLIEKETALPEERPLISSVFHRRLKEGMRLQCDPTVVYASTVIGKFDGVIRQSDLNLISPYNTYQIIGLPAGPIANPGLASLDAALHPADSRYLYFVARKDGSHQFSASLTEHNRAVTLYQR